MIGSGVRSIRELLLEEKVRAEKALDMLRAQIDAAVENGGGHIPRERALDFGSQLEVLTERIHRLRRDLAEMDRPAPPPRPGPTSRSGR